MIEELVSLIERRDCALLSHRAQHNLTDLCDNAQSIGHILHNVSKHINKTSEPTYVGSILNLTGLFSMSL